MDELIPRGDENDTSAGPQAAPDMEAAGPFQPAPFQPDWQDLLFALLAFAVGYLFVRLLLFSWQGIGVAVFTLLYCGFCGGYILRKRGAIDREGVFWLSVTFLTGLSFVLWDARGLTPWRELFLFGAAVYAVPAASGALVLGRTDNWLLLDGLNGLFLIPFKNFTCQYRSFSALKFGKKGLRTLLSILLGLLFALLTASVIMPQLLVADGGAFGELTEWIVAFFNDIFGNVNAVQMALSIPVAAYIFGLTAGCAHRRRVVPAEKETIQKGLASLRAVPALSAYILLGSMCVIYAAFVLTQLNYFFSAFAGTLPKSYAVYSEYARSGFFELCRIGVINLLGLAAVNMSSNRPRTGDVVLKVLNILLMLFTLLIIATAMSKMWLYIDAYGLSSLRLLAAIFMAVMAAICVAVILLQRRGFSIMRFGTGLCAVTMCLLSFINLDYFVASYNASRYLEGTLPSFDMEILYRSELAGVPAAVALHGQTANELLREELERYLDDMETWINSRSGSQYTVEGILARGQLEGLD